jgi:hypothetical protein
VDPRLVVIHRWDIQSRRRRLGLLTVRTYADAVSGYDGGRHARFIINAAAAGINAHSLLMTGLLLHRCKILVRAHGSVLAPPRMGGGGTIQGFPPSGDMYGTLAASAANHVAATVPPVAIDAPNLVLIAFRATYTGTLSINDAIPLQRILKLRDAAELVLYTVSRLNPVAGSQEQLSSIFTLCCNDSERLLLLDVLGTDHGESLEAVVDDLSFATSSLASNNLGITGFNTFALTQGIVYDVGSSDKTSFRLDAYPTPKPSPLELDHVANICGGKPRLTDCSKCVGVYEMSSYNVKPPSLQTHFCTMCHDDAELILKRVLGRGYSAAQNALHSASSSPKPMIARAFYIQGLDNVLDYLLPLCVASPRAAFALSRAQASWALSALLGRVPCHTELEFSSQVYVTVLGDLGWKLLWHTARVRSLMLFFAMQAQGETSPLGRSASRTNSPRGSWLFKVKGMISRLGISPPPAKHANETKDAYRRRLVRHRREVVEPAFGGLFTQWRPRQALPWAWLGAVQAPYASMFGFKVWWSLRLLKQLPSSLLPPVVCPLCNSDLGRDGWCASHLWSSCQAVSEWARRWHLLPEDICSWPLSPDAFMDAIGLFHRFMHIEQGLEVETHDHCTMTSDISAIVPTQFFPTTSLRGGF